MESFQRRFSDYFGDLDLNELDSDEWDSSSESGDSGDEDMSILETTADLFCPERTPLPLPSVLGLDKCKELGLIEFAKKEQRLREGQANDALHAIRLALGYKALLFRTEVRAASSQIKTTRAWKHVTAVETSVKQHSGIYRNARHCMVRLGASEPLLDHFKVLRNQDLKSNTFIVDLNEPDQRNKKLAWFWNMDVQRELQDGWMEECALRSVSWSVS
jgi:hypothetical protein